MTDTTAAARAATFPAAKRLIADATTAGLTVTTFGDDTFVRVAVANRDAQTALIAEWWDCPGIREFNYASTLAPGSRRERRASSLAAAREHVGLARK